jgi:hypothetical protein
MRRFEQVNIQEVMPTPLTIKELKKLNPAEREYKQSLF